MQILHYILLIYTIHPLSPPLHDLIGELPHLPQNGVKRTLKLLHHRVTHTHSVGRVASVVIVIVVIAIIIVIIAPIATSLLAVTARIATPTRTRTLIATRPRTCTPTGSFAGIPARIGRRDAGVGAAAELRWSARGGQG